MPILGGYIFMLLLNRRHLHFAIDRICKFYKSTVVGIYIGKYPVVLINDLENVKKSLNHRDFDGRPDLLMTQMRHPEFKPTQGLFLASIKLLKCSINCSVFSFNRIGIFFREGESWSEQRRFTLRYLRDYGFGRRFDSFEHQCEMLIKDFMDIVKNGPKYEHEKVHFKISIKSKMICHNFFLEFRCARKTFDALCVRANSWKLFYHLFIKSTNR